MTYETIDSSSDTKVNGSLIKGYLNYIKKTWGAEGLNQCLADIKLDASVLKEGRWYKDEINSHLLTWIAEKKGPEYVEKAGTYLIKNLGFLSYVMRFTRIQTLLKKAPVNYNDAFNYGKVKVELFDKKAIIKMKNTARDNYTCGAWLGAYKGMMEITRTKGTVIERQCEKDGSPHCEFVMEWK